MSSSDVFVVCRGGKEFAMEMVLPCDGGGGTWLA